MSKVDKIKYLTRMRKPLPRSRDAATETHLLHVYFTRDEALAVSQVISTLRGQNLPSFILVQQFCLSLAEQHLDEEKLVADMAKWRSRAKLAEELSEDELQVAMSLLSHHRSEKAAKAIRREESEARKQKKVEAPPKVQAAPTPPPAHPIKKILREFVPDTRRR